MRIFTFKKKKSDLLGSLTLLGILTYLGILNLLKTVTPEKSDCFFLSLLGILTYFGILTFCNI